jgi:hypothetical protein
LAYGRRNRFEHFNHRHDNERNRWFLHLVCVAKHRNFGGGIMAHFAQISNDIVSQVIVVSNDDCGGGDFPASEPIGQAFIASLGLTGQWLQTSYHANFRGKYAGSGDRYDATTDTFVSTESEA